MRGQRIQVLIDESFQTRAVAGRAALAFVPSPSSKIPAHPTAYPTVYPTVYTTARIFICQIVY